MNEMSKDEFSLTYPIHEMAASIKVLATLKDLHEICSLANRAISVGEAFWPCAGSPQTPAGPRACTR